MSVPSNAVQIQGLGSINADQANTYIQTVLNYAALRNFTGQGNMLAALLGQTTYNDGGQGMYYYTPTGSFTDNNSSIIVPYGAAQGAWISLDIPFYPIVTYFATLPQAQAAILTSATKTICILGYATPGDAPPRFMAPIATPSPVHPWQVQTADGSYWQDSSGDFWVEWLGALSTSSDCSTALNNAFLAHLYLGSVLRGRGTKTCASQVYWNTSGFPTRFCWADFNGQGNSAGAGGVSEGMQIVFNNNVAAPCFGVYSSTSQNEFYGLLRGLQITGNTNGLMAQIGRLDRGDPMNRFVLDIVIGNQSTGGSAAIVLVTGLFTSSGYIQADGPGLNNPGSANGLYALQLSNSNQNNLNIAVGGMGVGLSLLINSAGNTFGGEIADNYIGFQNLSNTNEFNTWTYGGINDNTYAIDNHIPFESSGCAVKFTGATIFGGNTNIFFNPNATDQTWGGCGVVLDIAGEDYVNWAPPNGAVGASGTWYTNLGAIPYEVSILGASFYSSGGSLSFYTATAYVRAWYDFSGAGFSVADVFPMNVTVGAGEKIQVNYSGGTYSLAWKPLTTI
jgi:hypothetical protein